jgi:hypothetical protein
LQRRDRPGCALAALTAVVGLVAPRRRRTFVAAATRCVAQVGTALVSRRSAAALELKLASSAAARLREQSRSGGKGLRLY